MADTIFGPKAERFKTGLTDLLNEHGMDAAMDMADHVLADYLIALMLALFDAKEAQGALENS